MHQSQLFSEDAFLSLAKGKCKNTLETFATKARAFATTSVLLSMFENCERLKSLSMRSRRHFSVNVTLFNLVNRLINLELNYFDLDDNDIILLTKNSGHLKYLGICGSPQITDISVLRIAVKCTRLTNIDVSRCILLTDWSAFSLLKYCHELRVMNLNFTQVNFKSIVFTGSFVHIKVLYLCDCDIMTVDSLLTISSIFPNLMVLYCRNINRSAKEYLQRYLLDNRPFVSVRVQNETSLRSNYYSWTSDSADFDQEI
jgi:hypothetical protein